MSKSVDLEKLGIYGQGVLNKSIAYTNELLELLAGEFDEILSSYVETDVLSGWEIVHTNGVELTEEHILKILFTEEEITSIANRIESSTAKELGKSIAQELFDRKIIFEFLGKLYLAICREDIYRIEKEFSGNPHETLSNGTIIFFCLNPTNLRITNLLMLGEFFSTSEGMIGMVGKPSNISYSKQLNLNPDTSYWNNLVYEEYKNKKTYTSWNVDEQKNILDKLVGVENTFSQIEDLDVLIRENIESLNVEDVKTLFKKVGIINRNQRRRRILIYGTY